MKRAYFIFLICTFAFFLFCSQALCEKSELNETATGNSFLVLYYPKNISAIDFQEQLNMLKKNGYSFINQSQILDFYNIKKPLPEKSVLIAFYGLRESFNSLNASLDKFNIRPLMFLNIKEMKKGITSYISWHDLKLAVKADRMDFGIYAKTQNDAIRDKLYSEKRFKGLVAKSLSTPLNIDIAHNIIGDYFALSFACVYGRYNYIETSPLDLNLIKVSSSWGTLGLKYFMENQLFRCSDFKSNFKNSDLSPDLILTSGKAFINDGKLILKTSSWNRGAEIWLLGSGSWRDAVVNFSYLLQRGDQFWIYVRYKDKDNYVRFGQAKSKFYLQQKINGIASRSLIEKSQLPGRLKTKQVKLIVRGAFIEVFLDGKKLFKSPFILDSSLDSGEIGFAVWSGFFGGSQAQFEDIDIMRLRNVWLVIPLPRKGDLEKINKNMGLFSFITPEWFVVDNGVVSENIFEPESLLMLARYYKAEIIPNFEIKNPENLNAIVGRIKNEIKLLIDKYHCDGVNFDISRAKGDILNDPSFVDFCRWVKRNNSFKLCLIVDMDAYAKNRELGGIANIDMLGIKVSPSQISQIGEKDRQKTLVSLSGVSLDNFFASYIDICSRNEKTVDFKGVLVCQD